MTSLDATVNANETLSGGSVTHVGQMFFDQSLITLVEEVEPYASNGQELTNNANDSILSEEAATTDPFIEYVFLGDSVADGIFGWLAFGMDTSVSYNITPAAYLTENGGVENENAGAGMGGGPPGGSGAPPSGGVPTGTMPAGAVASGVVPSSISNIAISPSVASSLTSGIVISASGGRHSGPAPSDKPQRGDGKSTNGHNSPQNGSNRQNQKQSPQATENH
jgi:hypothetical protein